MAAQVLGAFTGKIGMMELRRVIPKRVTKPTIAPTRNEPRRRVKLGYLPIDGGILFSWITFAITALMERDYKPTE
jgi:hypothetical protein